jgi:hypothetical protein
MKTSKGEEKERSIWNKETRKEGTKEEREAVTNERQLAR